MVPFARNHGAFFCLDGTRHGWRIYIGDGSGTGRNSRVPSALCSVRPLQDEVLVRARDNQIFIAHLAGIALENKPPLGFFRHLVLSRSGERAHTLDLKLGGLVPIVDLAHIYALASGNPARNTYDRLRGVAGTPALSSDGAANLEDALALIGTVRARHQANQIRAGLEPDNFVPPEELSARERSHLKDAFAAVRTMQHVLAERYQTERFLKCSSVCAAPTPVAAGSPSARRRGRCRTSCWCHSRRSIRHGRTWNMSPWTWKPPA